MEVVDLTIVVPVMNDEAGLLATLGSINAAAGFGTRRWVVEVVVVDGNGSSSTSLAGCAHWPNLRIRQLEDPKGGPYAAVDLGLRASHGRIQSWLNAGDYLFPQAIELASQVFEEFPATRWVCGSSCLMTEGGLIGRIDAKPVYYPQRFIASGWYRKSMLGYLQQEGMFWDRSLYLESGGLDRSLRLAADFALWTKFAQRSALTSVAAPFAAFEVSPSTQRSRVHEGDYVREVKSVAAKSIIARLFEVLYAIHYAFVVCGRFLVHARGKVIMVDPESGRLVQCAGVWPAARVSWWNLVAAVRVSRKLGHA